MPDEQDDNDAEAGREGWAMWIVRALFGAIVGPAVLASGFMLLWWNEGLAVRSAKGLEEVGCPVASVSADQVDPQNEGRVVHVAGDAQVHETLTDPAFGVLASAIKLRRRVEILQWKEEERRHTVERVGGETQTDVRYAYHLAWSDKPIDSSLFQTPRGHKNQGGLRFESQEWSASRVTLGAFTLSPALIAQMGAYEPLRMDRERLDALPEDLRKDVQLDEGRFYFGPDPAHAQIGDLRVTFEIVRPAQVAVIARQSGNSFAPWQPSAQMSVERLSMGRQADAELADATQPERTVLAWLFRVAGFVILAIGLGLLFGPLPVIAKLLPWLDDILRLGVGCFAVVVAAFLTLATVAAAWFLHRPQLGICLMAGGLFLMFLGRGFGRVRLRRSDLIAQA